MSSRTDYGKCSKITNISCLPKQPRQTAQSQIWRSSLNRVFSVCYSGKPFVNSSLHFFKNRKRKARERKVFEILEWLPYQPMLYCCLHLTSLLCQYSPNRSLLTLMQQNVFNSCTCCFNTVFSCLLHNLSIVAVRHSHPAYNPWKGALQYRKNEVDWGILIIKSHNLGSSD